ncbi:MAG TPA: UdgX family uracil-DNA binding protein [Candidatus Limnocylindrales bacterium]
MAGPGPGIDPADPDTWTARSFVPPSADLASLRDAAAACRGCDLWQPATQVVFGDGSVDARLMLVGEQPGDREDLAGRPFVGPAGAILDRALADAGIDRRDLFVTNVVKHFKWRPSGKRRLHERPNSSEVRACRPWLDAELGLVQPAALVALGATAAQALLGPEFRVSRHRGTFVPSDLAPRVLATLHPSAILRAPMDDAREEQYQMLVADLKVVAREIGRDSGLSGPRTPPAR